MFGAFRCSKDSRDNLKYVDLSGNRTVDARNYTILACDQCRDRKLKCSGDIKGCQRCQTTNTKCTYRSSARSPDHSKRRQSSAESETAPAKPRPKRQRRKGKADTRPTPEAEEDPASPPTDTMEEPVSSADLTDGFWTPVSLSDPTFVDFVHDWDDNQSPSLDMTLGDTSSLSLMSPSQSSPQPHSALTNESFTNDIFLTAPPCDTDTVELIDTDLTDYTRGGCGCDCLRALADILERIHVSGDSGDIDQGTTTHFDDLLGHLRDGIETCKQVLPCNYCSVRTANSTLVVTVVHQLALMSQDLCHQLLAHQQLTNTAPAAAPVEDPPPLLLSSEVYVGKYHVRSGPLYVEFILAIVGAHLEDLRRLMELLRGDVRKRSRAAKLLGDAADVATRTVGELQRNAERRDQ